MIMNFIRGVNNDCLRFKNRRKGFINSIDGDIKLSKRLLALGCINSTEIEVKRLPHLETQL